jgi:hypothetical protein
MMMMRMMMRNVTRRTSIIRANRVLSTTAAQDDDTQVWVRQIDRRRRALALVLTEGEKERHFFKCNYYGLLTTAGVLSSAQFMMWGYMSFSIVTAVEKSPFQSALSLSAFAFSGLAMILISPASRSLVSELSLLPDRKLRIKSHFPEHFGGSNEIPVDEMQIREVPDSRFVILERVNENERFLMDVNGGRFVGTDMDALRTLLRRRVVVSDYNNNNKSSEAINTQKEQEYIQEDDQNMHSVAVTRERRLRQYHNKRRRLGKMWRKRKMR